MKKMSSIVCAVALFSLNNVTVAAPVDPILLSYGDVFPTLFNQNLKVFRSKDTPGPWYVSFNLLDTADVKIGAHAFTSKPTFGTCCFVISSIRLVMIGGGHVWGGLADNPFPDSTDFTRSYNDLPPGRYAIEVSGSGDRHNGSSTNNAVDFVTRLSVLPATPVDLSGTIMTPEGEDICTLVLANGKHRFTCNPNMEGIFNLYDLPRDNDGTVKRQIYAFNFFPKIDVLTDSIDDAVVMTHADNCTDYNTPYNPGTFPNPTGRRIEISGKVLMQNSQTPVCALVLANGNFMFTCDGTGRYATNIPLDQNGQFRLFAFAEGFAPAVQTFDELSTVNDVRMARAVECQ